MYSYCSSHPAYPLVDVQPPRKQSALKRLFRSRSTTPQYEVPMVYENQQWHHGFYNWHDPAPSRCPYLSGQAIPESLLAPPCLPAPVTVLPAPVAVNPGCPYLNGQVCPQTADTSRCPYLNSGHQTAQWAHSQHVGHQVPTHAVATTCNDPPCDAPCNVAC